MEITGQQHVAAPRQRVWEALNDPAVLQACLPGCQAVERTGDDGFKVAMTAAVGPLRARFAGTLRVTEAVPPASCVLVFEGQGGAVGFGKGSSSVALAEAPGGATALSYAAKAQVGGKLAQVGSRLIDGVARKMADDFFAAFRRQVAPEAAASLAAEAPGETAAASNAPGALGPSTTSAAPGGHATPTTPSRPAAAPPPRVAGVPWWAVPLAFAAGLLAGLCF